MNANKMAAAYGNVARLKGAGKLSALPQVGAATGGGRPRQRKWRVLVSIGLLLPALAAIIGEYQLSVGRQSGGSSTGALERAPRLTGESYVTP